MIRSGTLSLYILVLVFLILVLLHCLPIPLSSPGPFKPSHITQPHISSHQTSIPPTPYSSSPDPQFPYITSTTQTYTLQSTNKTRSITAKTLRRLHRVQALSLRQTDVFFYPSNILVYIAFEATFGQFIKRFIKLIGGLQCSIVLSHRISIDIVISSLSAGLLQFSIPFRA